MTAEDIVREIRAKHGGPPKTHAAYGSHVLPAWAVRKLVEQHGWTVSDAVRAIVDAMRLHPPERAFNGVRKSYYEIRKRDWSEEPNTES